ncbi:MAG: polyprenyl synthetase family protein [Paracoccaceae bacterium]|nr:polyprenyl synthetase family protein [Paracoccaceae bacterium]
MMFTTALAEDAARVQTRLHAALAGSDLPLLDAMRYATRGGKGLRGFLVLESARMLGADAERALPAAAAVEALHAYSLIHDDLPAMDNDDLRRGQPTVHVKWDEATAILAGDALQTLAFELLTDPAIGDAETSIRLVAGLAHAAGANGMVLGQALDMAAEVATTQLTLEDISRLQAGKTGALITWSAEAGAIIAGADPTPLRRYATALGLAFQIADDILDVTGDAAKAGKRLQKDAAAGKATFVSLLGLEGARSRAKALVNDAEAALEPFGAAADTLRHCARFVIAREM